VKVVKIIRTHVHGAYKFNGKLLFHITERRMLKRYNRHSRFRHAEAAGPELTSEKYKTGMTTTALHTININILFKFTFTA
jgi:hypothetical protein